MPNHFQTQNSKMKVAIIFALVVLVAVAHADDFDNSCGARQVAHQVPRKFLKMGQSQPLFVYFHSFSNIL